MSSLCSFPHPPTKLNSPKKKKASGGSGPVVELNENNFKEMVLDSDEMWLVEFFAPWCGHCQKLAPEWESAAGQLSGSVNVSYSPPPPPRPPDRPPPVDACADGAKLAPAHQLPAVHAPAVDNTMGTPPAPRVVDLARFFAPRCHGVQSCARVHPVSSFCTKA